MTPLKKSPVWAKILIGIGGWFLGSMLIMMIFVNSSGLAIGLFISFLFIYPLVFYNLAAQKKVMLIRCPNCKYEGQGKFITKGSFGMEVILWLFLIVPGLIYSVWRLSNKKWTCPQCDFEHVVKIGMAKATS